MHAQDSIKNNRAESVRSKKKSSTLKNQMVRPLGLAMKNQMVRPLGLAINKCIIIPLENYICKSFEKFVYSIDYRFVDRLIYCLLRFLDISLDRTNRLRVFVDENSTGRLSFFNFRPTQLFLVRS